MTRRVVVIGGGVGGATAALRLADEGVEVVLVEQSDELGGLVVSFSVAGTPLECFYHHIFPHEHNIQELIGRLGLTSRLEWFPSSVGVFTGGRVWPFTTPLDLLRFRPLPPLDRLRAGVGALRLQRVRDWEPLDQVPAAEWLAKHTGVRTAETVWQPLLRAKFGPAAADVPAAWMWGRLHQRAGARKRRGGERLGYLRGGFRQMFERLDVELRRLGVDLRTATAISAIDCEGGRVQGVTTADGAIEADDVLYTGPLSLLSKLMPAGSTDPRWDAIPGLGVQCTILEVDRPLSSIYWTNVCDPSLPFGGVIEHTNLLPAADYGGRRVVYLSRYFTADEDIAHCEPAAEQARWLGALAERWPGFVPSSVLGVSTFRAPYAAPLVAVGHFSRIPPLASDVAGLWVSTTAQIYPEDRGMSEAVRTGQAAAAAIVASAERLPAG